MVAVLLHTGAFCFAGVMGFSEFHVFCALQVEVAILHLYNIINRRLPGWQDPPSSKEIKVHRFCIRQRYRPRNGACLARSALMSCDGARQA